MAVGLPVIASETTIDRYYFSNGSVLFFESENADDLAEKVLFLLENPEELKHLVQVANNFLEANRWEKKKEIYLGIIRNLVRK